MNDFRETLNGEGYSISFEDAIFLQQFGIPSEYFFRLVADMENDDLRNRGFKREKFAYK